MQHPTPQIPMTENTDTRDAGQIMQDSQELYDRKNADYGDSWRLAGKTMALWFQHQGMDEVRIPTNEYHMTSFQLFTRRLDKMIRTFNGWFMLEIGDDLKVDESVVETHEDEVPYAAIHTQLAEEYAALDYSDFMAEDTR